MNMTHPVILTIERTGYPPGHIFAPECNLCGEMAADDSGLCKNCKSVECELCGHDCPNDEITEGICEDCLKQAARHECTALAYLTQLNDVNTAQEVAENTVWALFGHERGENVYRKYEFLTNEVTEILKAKLSGESWHVINYMTLKWPVLFPGIICGLRETCMDDKRHFGEWLAKREKISMSHQEVF